jgi:hypothetical protein
MAEVDAGSLGEIRAGSLEDHNGARNVHRQVMAGMEGSNSFFTDVLKAGTIKMTTELQAEESAGLEKVLRHPRDA